VYAAEEINNEALINVSSLTKGVYIVKVTNDKNVFTSKFVKQ
jgi:phage host-nuclease inhibitor protein Gam